MAGRGRSPDVRMSPEACAKAPADRCHAAFGN